MRQHVGAENPGRLERACWLAVAVHAHEQRRRIVRTLVTAEAVKPRSPSAALVVMMFTAAPRRDIASRKLCRSASQCLVLMGISYLASGVFGKARPRCTASWRQSGRAAGRSPPAAPDAGRFRYPPDRLVRQRGVGQRGGADADQAECGAVRLARQQRCARLEQGLGQLGGLGQALAAGAELEMRRSSASAPARPPPGPRRAAGGRVSRRAARVRRLELGEAGDIGGKSGLGADGFALPLQAHRPRYPRPGRAPRATAPPSPSLPARARSSKAASWPMREMPSAASRFTCAGPMPGSRPTFSGASNAAASAPSTENPRGLPRSAASLASSRLRARPMETVMPSSASTRRAKRSSTTAGGAPCNASVPERSSTASSMESGCTSGVRASIIARTWRETAAYFAISGRITTACGHSLRALNIGMAARTPYSLRHIAAGGTTPRAPPPTITGKSRSSGRSRFSTLA